MGVHRKENLVFKKYFFIYVSMPVVHRNNNIKKFITIFSTPLIKNSYTFQFFQLHNKKFVYQILGHCNPREQNPDQLFG